MLKEILKSTCLVLLGSFIFAIAINSVTIPNQLGEGGVTGITLLLYYLLGISPALSNFIINSVIMIIGWKHLDKETTYYTLLSVFAISVFLQYIKFPAFVPDNTVLSPLVSGLLIGTAIGLVILGRGTTAGVDIIGLILNKYFGIPISNALLIIDTLIVIPLFFTIGVERGVLTLISLFLTSKALNFFIEGFNPKKAIVIVSDKYDEIAQAIMANVGRGITVLQGYGYYSKVNKNVLYVVINRIQLMKTQRIINEIDPNAFVTVTAIQQVIGEGFTFHLENKHAIEENNTI